jgi:hypothetical protein
VEPTPESYGPLAGSPCDFEKDAGGENSGDVAPYFRVEDEGREPRSPLVRGAAGPVAKMWLLTIDQTMNLGFEKLGVVHSRESLLFAVEPQAEARLRFTVTAAEAGPIQIENGTLADDERSKVQRNHIEQNRKQIGDYYDVLLDQDGQPSTVDPTGDRDPLFAGRMVATAVGMPVEPLGIGARWVAGGGRGLVNSMMEYRVTDRRGEVTTIEARITTVMGPMRQAGKGKPQEFWSHDQLDEIWTIDAGTPVTGFRGKRVMRAFIAECEAGRIQVHQMVTETRANFAPGP